MWFNIFISAHRTSTIMFIPYLYDCDINHWQCYLFTRGIFCLSIYTIKYSSNGCSYFQFIRKYKTGLIVNGVSSNCCPLTRLQFGLLLLYFMIASMQQMEVSCYVYAGTINLISYIVSISISKCRQKTTVVSRFEHIIRSWTAFAANEKCPFIPNGWVLTTGRMKHAQYTCTNCWSLHWAQFICHRNFT